VSTLLLSAADIRRLLDREALLRALRAAFAQYSTRKAIPALRAGSPLPGPGGRTVMIVFPGIIDGIPAFTVLRIAKLRAARNQPSEDTTARLEALENRVQELEQEQAEVQERLDFAERVLSKARDERRIGG